MTAWKAGGPLVYHTELDQIAVLWTTIGMLRERSWFEAEALGTVLNNSLELFWFCTYKVV